jgi:hypothetical protein
MSSHNCVYFSWLNLHSWLGVSCFLLGAPSLVLRLLLPPYPYERKAALPGQEPCHPCLWMPATHGAVFYAGRKGSNTCCIAVNLLITRWSTQGPAPAKGHKDSELWRHQWEHTIYWECNVSPNCRLECSSGHIKEIRRKEVKLLYNMF